MGSLKTLFVFAVLVAGLYVVYVYLNRNPEVADSLETAQPWSGSPDVSPGTATPSSNQPWNSTSSAPSFGSTTPQASPTVSFPNPASDSASNGSSNTPFYGSSSEAATPASAITNSSENTLPTMTSPSVTMPTENQTPLPTGAQPGQGPTAIDPATILQGGSPSADYNPPQPSDTAAMSNAADDPQSFDARMSQALATNHLADAHLMLSKRYFDTNTSPAEREQMEPLLDQLAGTVVYSQQSLIDAPYVVLATDTLQSIADKYNVPVEFLAKVNGLDPNARLQPGRQIKVISGPFAAVVDLNRCELTLMLEKDNRYAGRFKIGVGPDMRQEGVFMVNHLEPVGAVSPNGSRGIRWIGFGQNMALHETNPTDTLGQPIQQGCIGLSSHDIEDLCSILSLGSNITIRR